MDPETKNILEETLKLSKENNKILRRMRSANRWSMAVRLVYWVIIISSMLGFYYYFQPLIDNLVSSYNSLMSEIGKVQNVGDSLSNIGALLKK